MAVLKYTWLFQLFTNVASPDATIHRIGGWSETWYDENLNVLLGSANLWAQKRALLLPQGAAIVGLRTQQVDPVGGAQTFAMNYPGINANSADIPQMALQCKAIGVGVRNVRTFTLRGIPDGQVTQGEYKPVPPFDTNLANFFKMLKQSAWNFRGRDLAQVAHPILTIDPTGIVAFSEPHGLAVGDYVRVLRTVLANGRQFGGRFYVDAVPSPLKITITGWSQGATTGGKGRKDAIVHPNVESATFDRIITRRVGRPFIQYRGRRSKKH